MKTLVFAGTKGGSGKTTLCYNFAIEAAWRRSVLLADMDPQQSLAEMWKRRGERSNPRMVENLQTVTELVKRLKDSGFDRDLLFVDTPGSNMTAITDAVMAANAVVVPVQPSPMDLLAQGAVCDLVENLGKQRSTIFVLNRVEARSDLAAEARNWLTKNYGYPVFEVRHRAAYARAAIAGMAAAEIDRSAAREIGALWRQIEERMK
jgi:chromosome partitioning protein